MAGGCGRNGSIVAPGQGEQNRAAGQLRRKRGPTMTKTPPGPPGPGPRQPDRRRLSALLKRPLVDSSGESIGRLSDVIVRLRGDDYPVVTGLVASVGGREVYVPVEQVSNFDGDVLHLTSAKLNLRHFERRPGEV